MLPMTREKRVASEVAPGASVTDATLQYQPRP
jgi:hypothetical protein